MGVATTDTKNSSTRTHTHRYFHRRDDLCTQTLSQSNCSLHVFTLACAVPIELLITYYIVYTKYIHTVCNKSP